MNEVINFIENKSGNIGALCGFLKSNKNKKYLEFIEDNIIDLSKYNLTLSEKLYYYFNDIKLPLLCDCEKHLKFIGFKNGYRPTCGDKKCYVKKRKETCLDKYGVENPNQLEEIKNKSKKTIEEKYGGKHYMYDESVRSKFNKTMVDKYGSDWAMSNDLIKSKSKKTWLNKTEGELKSIQEKRYLTNSLKTEEELKEIEIKKNRTKIKNYGSLQNFNKEIQNKIRETSLERYGVEHFFMLDDVIEKRTITYSDNFKLRIIYILPNNYLYIKHKNYSKSDIKLDIHHKECDSIFNIRLGFLNKRLRNNEELCLNCNKVMYIGTSLLEKDLQRFILNNYNGTIDNNTKNVIGKYELDIYLPDLNVAFEFNGLYWHSELHKDNTYHLNKTEKCLKRNIQLIHIYEDDWLYKQDIVKSRILNILGKTPNKIFSRKCKIEEVTDNKLIRQFLEDNHIQGFVGGKVRLGLFYNGELVSLMTFGNLRKNLGQKLDEGSWELLRFCNKKYTNVVGSASKLFKYFINNYKYESIISYADRSWSIGGLYKNLGFDLEHTTKPNYYYVDKLNVIRLNRFNFRKDKLVKEGFDSSKSEYDIMFERGYYRIYDSGSYKFIYKKIKLLS